MIESTIYAYLAWTFAGTSNSFSPALPKVLKESHASAPHTNNCLLYSFTVWRLGLLPTADSICNNHAFEHD